MKTLYGILLVVTLCMSVAWCDLTATDFGAKADGSDSTAAIQSALDKASETGGVVRLPAGQYRINGTLLIPEGVTLEGEWCGPHTSHLDKGTVLLAYANRNIESGTPFISLQTSSTVKGLTIFYPEQTVEDIQPYPWTIQGRGQHYNVIDVTVVNAYNGIDCGTYHNEGHHLRNVLICAVRRGVLIDQTSDIGRVENVHIHNVYWWRVSKPYSLNPDQVKKLERYTLDHLEGFIIGRTDWEYMSNCFVIWAKTGFRFADLGHGLPNVVLTQCGSDISPCGIIIDQVQKHAGVAFENCQIMAGLEIRPTNEGPVKMTNCGFWGTPGTGSQVVQEGQGTVTFIGCHFTLGKQQPKDEPYIKAVSGSLIVQGCEFFDHNRVSPDIFVGENVQTAVIMGNKLSGADKVSAPKDRPGQVQVLGNVSAP
ncbi:MAG TPA: glycosyl hydrolase family 28-related protein [bacterium]|nr:glycosyl hydrolase family 28-related protein [bacterium]